MRRFLCFACAILLALKPIGVNATSRTVENLNADFVVQENIVLSGRKLPAQDFVLLIDLRHVESMDFFDQLWTLEDELQDRRFAVILMANSAYVLKDFDEVLNERASDLQIIKSAMTVLWDAKEGNYVEEHIENALQYAIEADKPTLRTAVKNFVAKNNVDMISVNLHSSCLETYRKECEIGYFYEQVNLQEGFLRANELVNGRNLPIIFYGNIETAWYTDKMLIANSLYSGQRGIMVNRKRSPAFYVDTEFILSNGGTIAYQEFLKINTSETRLDEFFAEYGAEIAASATDSAPLLYL